MAERRPSSNVNAEAALNKHFEELVNSSMKTLSQMHRLKDPMRFKLKIEFGDSGPSYRYMAKVSTKPELYEDIIVDTIDKGDMVTVLAQLPSMITHNDINLEGSVSTLFISVGDTTSSVRLPKRINASKASASFNNNVLEVNLPKGYTRSRTKIKMDGKDAKKDKKIE